MRRARRNIGDRSVQRSVSKEANHPKREPNRQVLRMVRAYFQRSKGNSQSGSCRPITGTRRRCSSAVTAIASSHTIGAAPGLLKPTTTDGAIARQWLPARNAPSARVSLPRRQLAASVRARLTAAVLRDISVRPHISRIFSVFRSRGRISRRWIAACHWVWRPWNARRRQCGP